MKKYTALMVFDIASDLHTLSASPALVATLPVEYMQLPGTANSARSTSTAPQYYYGEMDASADYTGQVLALFGTFTRSATVRVKLYSGAGRVGLVYDTGVENVAPKGKNYFHVFAGFGEFRSYEILLSDASNPDGYHQVSRLQFGPAFRPVISIQPSFSYTANSTTKQTRNAGGGLTATPGGSFRDFAFEFRHLAEDERAQLDTYLEDVGMHKDWFLALRPIDSSKYDFARCVMFAEMPPIGFSYQGHYNASFRVTDALGSGIASAAVAPVAAPIAPGKGSEGSALGYWTANLNGNVGASTAYPVASDGDGIVVAITGGNTIRRSTDGGVTFSDITLTGVPRNIVDVAWTGLGFAICGDSGDLYVSADGDSGTWTQVHTDAAGATALNAIGGIDDFILAGGEKLYAWDGVGGFADVTATVGWTDSACSFVIVSDAYIFVGSGSGIDLIKYDGISVTSVTPTGLSGTTYTSAIYGYGVLVVLMDDGNVYASDNQGTSFVLWYAPPPRYDVYDMLLTTSPDLIFVLEREDGVTEQRRIVTTVAGQAGFVEFKGRIVYDGRIMLLLEPSRELTYEITAETSGSINTGISTDNIQFRALAGPPYVAASLPYTVSAGVVDWEAGTPFTGKIILTINNTAF
jgi:hypothetical protein